MLYNILILNYEYPPLGGGAGIITSHLADEFTDAGHKVFVLTSWFEGLPEKEVTGNLTIKRLHTRRAKLDRSNVIEMYSYMRKALQYVKKQFKEGQFDVCLANFTLPGGIVGLKMKKELNLPYAIISHGHDIPWFYPKQMFFWHLAMYPIIKKVCLGSGRNILLTPEM
ncbi:MAG: glycosyltransferase, partial [Bacteroidetes bacterium]|nr:glycosyltransferase [Bacteroidota bacterium]